MKIRKLFSEIETSNMLVRMYIYVRYLNLQHYEAGMQYDAHECLLQLLGKIYLSINDNCILKLIDLKCSHTTNGEHSYCGPYISGVKLENTWFFISDTGILKQEKLQCNSRDMSVPYILIYKRRNNFLTVSPDKLNGPARVHPTKAVM